MAKARIDYAKQFIPIKKINALIKFAEIIFLKKFNACNQMLKLQPLNTSLFKSHFNLASCFAYS